MFSGEGPPGHARRGEALDSIVCSGGIVSGGQVVRSVLSPRVRAEQGYAVVEDSILFDGVDVGRYCRVRRAIIDKEVKLPPYTVLGYDTEFDRKRGFTITEGGIVVVSKAETARDVPGPEPTAALSRADAADSAEQGRVQLAGVSVEIHQEELVEFGLRGVPRAKPSRERRLAARLCRG
ncbi:MAG: hypothetical protein U0792_06985 [Gemmataceae bacterium]